MAVLATSRDALAPFASMLLEAFALGAQARLVPGLATFVVVVALMTAGDLKRAVFAALVIAGAVSRRARHATRARPRAPAPEQLSTQLAAEQERSAQLAVELDASASRESCMTSSATGWE